MFSNCCIELHVVVKPELQCVALAFVVLSARDFLNYFSEDLFFETEVAPQYECSLYLFN